MKRHFILTVKICLLLVATQEVSSQSALPDSLFKVLKYRNVGPFRGGRSVCATGVPNDPLTYYMGTTGGGLWKTTNAGGAWKNISDNFFNTGSVGAIAVDKNNTNVVYCGMGEHAPRGVMTSYGDGVYKSTDAGKTWKSLGLANTRHIARIVIDPLNSNNVYVAAQGALNGPTKERGVYKSTDGGHTWTNILYVNDLTGCSELSIDSNNPSVLYATMWEHQRLPWKVISGGSGSGMYKTSDGGATWKKIQNGLPKELGKMAVAVCPTNSDRVYAVIESDSEKQLGGLYVSENGGEKWALVSQDHRLVQRAWYYIEVFADPNDENTVYVMSAQALRSIDGGKTWQTIRSPHSDYHGLWINPKNSKNMIIANDGGASISFNYGATWTQQNNQPTGQFYRVAVDNQFPYRLYGGQQDNTSVVISSLALGRSGIGEQNWSYSAGGESAFLAFDPDDPQFTVGGSYLGTIEMFDSKAEAGYNIMASPLLYLALETKDMKYRYNWNAPIIRSKHETNTYYHGAQLLLRTQDNGVSWEEASPDLTRNDKSKQGKGGGPYTNEAVGAENYGTISYIMESPHTKGVIWTGSDDGLVYLTRDNGKNWSNVTPKGLQECLINSIEVSPHDSATAYIATTRYKFNDFTPSLLKTTDFGKTWVNISSGIPEGAYTRVVREDNKRKNLLFAGTETGILISFNGGVKWEPFKLNMPVVPITDLQINHDDLIVATAGRAFWILDDLELVRQLKPASNQLELYKPADAILASWGSEFMETDDEFADIESNLGVNPANGVVIYYSLPKIADSTEVRIDILNNDGKIIRHFSSIKDKNSKSWAGGPSQEKVLTTRSGLNRLIWDMRHATLPGVENVYIEGSYRGHIVEPGNYKIELHLNDQILNNSCTIKANPKNSIKPEQYKEYDDLMSTMEQRFTQMHDEVNRLYKSQLQLKQLLDNLPKETKYSKVKSDGKKLLSKMETWDQKMVQRKSTAYDDVENYLNGFTAHYLFVINQSDSFIPIITKSTRSVNNELTIQWDKLNREADAIDAETKSYTQQLWELGIGAISEFGD